MTVEASLENQLRRAVERLYEDERLRAGLTDAEARALLSWGKMQLEESAAASDRPAERPGRRSARPPDDDLLEATLRKTRAALSTVADLADRRGGLAESELRGEVADLLAAWLDRPVPAPPDSISHDELASLTDSADTREFILRLTALLSAHRAGANQGTPPGRPRPRRPLILGALLALLLCCAVTVGGYLALRPHIGSRPAPPSVANAPQPSTVTPLPATVTPAPATWYQVYFTSPVYPDTAAAHHGGLDEKLAAFIATATTSVDVAIYQLDLADVTAALLAAAGRGCRVRVVTGADILDDPKENPSFVQLEAAGIKVVGGNPNAIMHDKFVVVDDTAVWTGSWNFTDNDTYRYNNNAIQIQSPALAHNYTATFEKMWAGGQFGRHREPGGTTPHLTIDGIKVENYFAPEDGVTEKIVARLQAAQKSIDFLAYSFTSDPIGDAVLARAQAGVQVRGVFETVGSETRYSEYGRMRSAGLAVYQDGNPYLMHHKVFIIDGETVIFGSFNFSQSAEQDNDENLLVVDEMALAGRFTEEFERVYGAARNPPKQ